MEWFNFNVVKVKETSRKMYDLCCKRAVSIGHAEYVRTDGKVSLENTFKNDMLNFLIYLGYADGRISKEEVKYINSLMAVNLTAESIRERAMHWDLMSSAILERAPLSLEPFVRSNNGAETGELSAQYYDLIMMYVTTFNYIGNDFIACNKEVLPGEIEALTSYIDMLRSNIEVVKNKMEDFVPTLAFKSGSRVRMEEKPEYTKILTEEDLINRNQRLTEERVEETHSEEKRSEEKRSEEVEDADKHSARKLETRESLAQDAASFNNPEEMNLEVLLKELNGLTGMESVKKEINNLVNLLKICQIRKEKGLQLPPMTNHMVFLGNPGTGKTTVARILSKIYKGLGVLSKGHLVEVDRSGLVASYMGQTGEKVMEVVEKAKGGILFIDEAYALTSGKQEGDFGQEAVDILNKAMEDYRDDLIVIAAGYHDEMQDFLDANPGLRSRFNRTIEFPNYSAEELVTIMNNRATKLDYSFDEEAICYVREYFEKVLAFPPDNFGNARSVRNYLDNAINNQANRLVTEANFDENELTRIKRKDLEELTLE